MPIDIHLPARWLPGFFEDRFNRYLISVLTLLGVWLLFGPWGTETEPTLKGVTKAEVHFYYSPSCPHCGQQIPVNEELKRRFPQVVFIYHDVSNPKEAQSLIERAREYEIPETELGVPATFIGGNYVIGFDSPATTGALLQQQIEDLLSGREIVRAAKAKPFDRKLTLPWFGEVDVLAYSLPTLAIVLGLVDGFNPCAMWVLVYLISLIMSIHDRAKMWTLVGSFVLASGILYFLFMSAWLNAFLVVGYVRPLTIVIGLAALGVGINNLKGYFTTHGEIACEVGDREAKRRTMTRIERIIASPLNAAAVLAMIGLAFMVNSIEFVCSSAIPVVFTQVLTLSQLSVLAYYGYLLLYDLFFMLDDLIIFGLAALAVSAAVGSRYARFCKLVGGVVLAGLGVVLAFAPGWLARIG